MYFLFFSFLKVIRPDRSGNWTLQIKFPQQRDSGIYECQVNTEPKMSLAFRLNVVGECVNDAVFVWQRNCEIKICIFFNPEAKASIVGPSDLYVKTGSMVKLVCSVSQGPHDLGTIYWHRGNFYQGKIQLIILFLCF
jgi:hypothetical protein